MLYAECEILKVVQAVEARGGEYYPNISAGTMMLSVKEGGRWITPG